MDRIEALKQFIQASPNDCFVRYGLVQEYVKADRFDEAIETFNGILSINPDYPAAYYHLGKSYEKSGRPDRARQAYEKGIETSRRTGDLHARSELEAALADLG